MHKLKLTVQNKYLTWIVIATVAAPGCAAVVIYTHPTVDTPPTAADVLIISFGQSRECHLYTICSHAWNIYEQRVTQYILFPRPRVKQACILYSKWNKFVGKHVTEKTTHTVKSIRLPDDIRRRFAGDGDLYITQYMLSVISVPTYSFYHVSAQLSTIIGMVLTV